MPTKTDTEKVIDTTTKAFEEATQKAQEQYLSMLEQSQAAALESYGAFVDVARKVEIPSVPGLEALVPPAEAMKLPVDAYESMFDFAAKLLENQREFTQKMLSVTAKA